MKNSHATFDTRSEAVSQRLRCFPFACSSSSPLWRLKQFVRLIQEQVPLSTRSSETLAVVRFATLKPTSMAFDSYGSTDSGVLPSWRTVGSQTSGRLRHSGRHRRYDDNHVVCTRPGPGTPSRAIDLFVRTDLLSPRIFLPTPNVRGLGLGKAFMEV
jgi:hypothetical protein